jgi:8-amino-7-oxononanoate synthase
MTPRPTGSALIDRWQAGDLGTLLRHRLRAGDDGRVFGIWDRGAGQFDIVSQDRFLRQAMTLAAGYRDSEVGPGQIVLIDCTDPGSTWLAFCAAILSGAVPVIQPVGLASSRTLEAGRSRLRQQLGVPPILVTNRRQGDPALGGEVAGAVFFDRHRTEAAPPGSEDWLGPAPSPHDLLHLQPTSGSTGDSRMVALTHANVLANCHALATIGNMAATEAMTSWLPLCHDMGLVGMALLSLVQGTDLYLLSPFDFLADPTVWFRALTHTASTVTASPSFGLGLAVTRVADESLRSFDLSALRLASCGGEPVRTATLAAFARRFARCGLRPGVLRPCYGLAEATLAVTYSQRRCGPTVVRVPRRTLGLGQTVVITSAEPLSGLSDAAVPDGCIELVSNGSPLAGCRVEIVGPGKAVPLRIELLCGEVVVTAASVADGYRAANGNIAGPPKGALRTGDIGFFYHGELYIVDRVGNVLIRNGENHSLTALEACLAAACGVGDEQVMVVDADIHDPTSPVVAVVEAARGTNPHTLAALASSEGRHLGVPVREVFVVGRGGLPKTSSGKKRHQDLRRSLRDGSLSFFAHRLMEDKSASPDARPNFGFPGTVPPGLIDTVIAVIRSACSQRGTAGLIDGNARLVEDLDLDSLALFEVAVGIEERSGSTITDRDLIAARTVADLAAAANAAMTASSGVSVRRIEESLIDKVPQLGRTALAQRGRRVFIDGRWAVDFASCNYLALDLHPTMAAAIGPMVADWGVHPSWTRAIASPHPYRELEQRLAQLIGAYDTVLFPTLTLLHFGVLPALAGPGGAILVDRDAHHSIHEAAELAGARGTQIRLVRHGDLEDTAEKLRATRGCQRRVVALDGVYSMSGRVPDLAGYLSLAEEFDALIYIDDAHGFGVLGEAPTAGAPYGRRGNGIARHLAVEHERLVYVAGLSKAFSTMGAFVACSRPEDRRRFMMASTLVFSGPVPVASLATGLAALDVNQSEGDAIRARLHVLSSRLTEGIWDLGLAVSNSSSFPIVTVEFGGLDDVISACRILWQHGILVTPAVFPAVPLSRGGARFSVTAANTDDEIDLALASLKAARDARRRFPIRRPQPSPRTKSVPRAAVRVPT